MKDIPSSVNCNLTSSISASPEVSILKAVEIITFIKQINIEIIKISLLHQYI
jgi:hypothetical protein